MKHSANNHALSPIWLRLILLSFLCACTSTFSSVANAQKVRVDVYHSGTDAIGLQVAHAIREAVRGSQAFQLASTENEAEFQIRLLTQDPDRNDGSGGDRTILALSYVMMNPANYKKDDPATWYNFFLSSSIARAGSRRVDEAARSAIATLDKLVEEHKRMARRR